ncbi:hypothetical protein JKP88DRAFT_240946 [Tribonema minus]|uniref:Uncharacterized protein n=1 Tax=Tribonema minus TaxID=303371 RepID=A0A835Z573_9STRA|nr:hypothetical protein JKP88DRAFT_240946 [Tribonema minus]
MSIETLRALSPAPLRGGNDDFSAALQRQQVNAIILFAHITCEVNGICKDALVQEAADAREHLNRGDSLVAQIRDANPEDYVHVTHLVEQLRKIACDVSLLRIKKTIVTPQSIDDFKKAWVLSDEKYTSKHCVQVCCIGWNPIIGERIGDGYVVVKKSACHGQEYLFCHLALGRPMYKSTRDKLRDIASITGRPFELCRYIFTLSVSKLCSCATILSRATFYTCFKVVSGTIGVAPKMSFYAVYKLCMLMLLLCSLKSSNRTKLSVPESVVTSKCPMPGPRHRNLSGHKRAREWDLAMHSKRMHV